jgi:hypothetical protein
MIFNCGTGDLPHNDNFNGSTHQIAVDVRGKKLSNVCIRFILHSILITHSYVKTVIFLNHRFQGCNYLINWKNLKAE